MAGARSPCSPSRQRPRRVAGPAPVLVYRPQAWSGRSSCSSECPTRTSHRPVARASGCCWTCGPGRLVSCASGSFSSGGKICLRGTVASGTGWSTATWTWPTASGASSRLGGTPPIRSWPASRTLAAPSSRWPPTWDAVDYVKIGGARNSTCGGRQAEPRARGDLAGLRPRPPVAVSGTTRCSARRHPWPTRRGSTSCRLLRERHAGSVYHSGSSSQDVARTPMAGRSMLDCQREVARTIGGIIFAACDGNLVLARPMRTAQHRRHLPDAGRRRRPVVGDIVGTTAWTRRHPWCRRPAGGNRRVARLPPSGRRRAGPDLDRGLSACPGLAAARALIPDAVSLCPRVDQPRPGQHVHESVGPA